jgi:hypothetical protein
MSARALTSATSFDYICEMDPPLPAFSDVNPSMMSLPNTSDAFNASAYVTCPQGHVTRTFLACDDQVL